MVANTLFIFQNGHNSIHSQESRKRKIQIASEFENIEYPDLTLPPIFAGTAQVFLV